MIKYLPSPVNEKIKQLPWLTAVVVILWYSLYGWGLAATISPLLNWLIAAAIAAFLAAALLSALFIAVPISLVTTWLVTLPLTLNTAVYKGGEQGEAFANIFSGNTFRGMSLSAALTLLLASFWFSPLFWSKRQMEHMQFSKSQTFWFLTAISWLGLGIGWLIGQRY